MARRARGRHAGGPLGLVEEHAAERPSRARTLPPRPSGWPSRHRPSYVVVAPIEHPLPNADPPACSRVPSPGHAVPGVLQTHGPPGRPTAVAAGTDAGRFDDRGSTRRSGNTHGAERRTRMNNRRSSAAARVRRSPKPSSSKSSKSPESSASAASADAGPPDAPAGGVLLGAERRRRSRRHTPGPRQPATTHLSPARHPWRRRRGLRPAPPRAPRAAPPSRRVLGRRHRPPPPRRRRELPSRRQGQRRGICFFNVRLAVVDGRRCSGRDRLLSAAMARRPATRHRRRHHSPPPLFGPRRAASAASSPGLPARACAACRGELLRRPRLLRLLARLLLPRLALPALRAPHGLDARGGARRSRLRVRNRGSELRLHAWNGGEGHAQQRGRLPFRRAAVELRVARRRVLGLRGDQQRDEHLVGRRSRVRLRGGHDLRHVHAHQLGERVGRRAHRGFRQRRLRLDGDADELGVGEDAPSEKRRCLRGGGDGDTDRRALALVRREVELERARAVPDHHAPHPSLAFFGRPATGARNVPGDSAFSYRQARLRDLDSASTRTRRRPGLSTRAI